MVSSAEAGDPVADKILQNAVVELAASVRAVVQRLGLCGKGAIGQLQPETCSNSYFFLVFGNFFLIWLMLEMAIFLQMGRAPSHLSWLVVFLKPTGGGILGEKF